MSAEPAPEEGAETDRLFALIRDRYGDRLGAAELDDLRRAVEAVVQTARKLRGVRLENSDEPVAPFVPYRAEP